MSEIKIKKVKIVETKNDIFNIITTAVDGKQYKYACSLVGRLVAMQFKEKIITQGTISPLTWF